MISFLWVLICLAESGWRRLVPLKLPPTHCYITQKLRRTKIQIIIKEQSNFSFGFKWYFGFCWSANHTLGRHWAFLTMQLSFNLDWTLKWENPASWKTLTLTERWVWSKTCGTYRPGRQQQHAPLGVKPSQPDLGLHGVLRTGGGGDEGLFSSSGHHRKVTETLRVQNREN